jgi:phosphogluconate dehydratase
LNNDELETDFVAVLPGQGPSANGMPELHKLTPYLGLLQNRGFKVALLTDGRMSGASGKVLAAIQVTPEANHDGAIGRIRDGDVVTIDANAGSLTVETTDDFAAREPQQLDREALHFGMGRELFAAFRNHAGGAEEGASIFGETQQ